MVRINKIIGFLATLILMLYGCSKGEHGGEEEQNSEVITTTLFGEVVEPEQSEVDDRYYAEEALSDDSSSESVTSPTTGSTSDQEFEPGVLTAGEWNDLDNWEFWNGLLVGEQYAEGISKWNLKEIDRYSFQVVDNKNEFIANAEISLLVNGIKIWNTKTDNKGEATLWSAKENEDITVSIAYEEENEIINNPKKYNEGINVVSIDKSIINNKKIDIYFAIDATGSMGDEIDYLKAELNNVIETVKQNNPTSEMRVGSVFYRDKEDEYITRDLPFTKDETSLISFIKEQSAYGGGDFPEAVSDALDVAITQNTWDTEASSKILFLLLDAPPHYTQETVSKLEYNLIKAAEEGIKIIPITASGIDKATEYLMRSFAILTNGTYVFITDHSGVGNSHIEPTVGEYEVQKLNELLINLIDSYIP